MGFKEDAIRGESVEAAFGNLLIQRGRHKQVLKAIGYHPDWDLLCDMATTYEIKDDSNIAPRTKKLAFEYWNNEKKSGISTTKAEYWVQWDGTYFYIFKFKELSAWLHMLKDAKAICGERTGEHAVSFLIPINKLIGQEFCETLKP